MSGAVRISFEPKVLELPVGSILPMRPMTPRIFGSRRYARVLTSVREIGIIEPLVINRANRGRKRLLLDGHLRLHALKELERSVVPCIVSDDDEAYTYNKRVNRLATVQEHFMISRALERGVPAAMIAAALGMDEASISRKRTLLDGISDGVVEILKDKVVSPVVFDCLRKMKPHRQYEATGLMAAMNNFTASYARAILAATRKGDLKKPDKPKRIMGLTPEQMARMERELETLNADFRTQEATFGDDVLQLVLSSRYLERLMGNANVTSYLASRHSDMLEQFRLIVEATSLEG